MANIVKFIVSLVFLVTCIQVALADEKERKMELEDWVLKMGANKLGSCKQKFVELVAKLGYK